MIEVIFTPDANCPMVRNALEGNTESLVAYNRDFYESLVVVVYTKSEKKVVSPFVEYADSDEEVVKIKWRKKEY